MHFFLEAKFRKTTCENPLIYKLAKVLCFSIEKIIALWVGLHQCGPAWVYRATEGDKQGTEKHKPLFAAPNAV